MEKVVTVPRNAKIIFASARMIRVLRHGRDYESGGWVGGHDWGHGGGRDGVMRG